MELDELPSGWTVKPLRDCVAPKEHWSLTRNPRQRIRYVELGGIDNERGIIADSSDIEAATAPSRAKKVIRTGDVIFATTRPNLKNIAIVPPELDDEICSTGFCVLRPQNDVTMSGWIFGIVRSDWFVNQVIRHDEKNAYPSVSDDEVLAVEIPVPPLAEQRRIVARLEALTRHLDQARQARQAALAETKTFISAQRCKLLETIRGAKESRFADLILETQLGIDRSRAQQSSEHSWAYLKMNNITARGTLDLESVTRIEATPDEVAKFTLREGDFLFNTRNSFELVGKTAVWRSSKEPVLFNNNIMRIRFRDGVDPRFVNAVFVSPLGEKQLLAFKKQTTSVCAIYWKNLKEVAVPIPSLAEQRRIVDSLDKLEAKLDELQRLQREVAAELASFTPALLAKAFRGEL